MTIKPVKAYREQDNLILEDKELVLILPDCAKYNGINHALVAGCIRSIGITLVKSKDTSIELLCLNKLSYKDSYMTKYVSYNDIFTFIQDGIINGRICLDDLHESLGIPTSFVGGDKADCSFK